MPGRLIAIASIVVLVLVFGIWVGVAQLTSSGSANRPTSPSVELVLNNTDSIVNKRIAVVGDVKTVLRPWGVLLGSSDNSQIGVLVIQKGTLPKSVQMNARVHVLGRVERFDLGAFERAHPGITRASLRRSPITSLDGQPALVDATIAPQSP